MCWLLLYFSMKDSAKFKRMDCTYLGFAYEFDTVPHHRPLIKMRKHANAMCRWKDGLRNI